ncbi:conserved protein of unknown function [Pseudomonas sp. JV241A]|nr:conserved protein of unknown function [Pseudomonas sp. JV241A]
MPNRSRRRVSGHWLMPGVPCAEVALQRFAHLDISDLLGVFAVELLQRCLHLLGSIAGQLGEVETLLAIDLVLDHELGGLAHGLISVSTTNDG